jgi:hypothetical protein
MNDDDDEHIEVINFFFSHFMKFVCKAKIIQEKKKGQLIFSLSLLPIYTIYFLYRN